MKNLSEIIRRRLLPAVRQPSQYIGCETNARRADVDAAEVTVLLAFPDSYSVGISHLGSAVLYSMLNNIPSVACDRTYCPTPEAEQVMRDRDIPLFGWESRCAIGGFDVLGFALSYELCVTNMLTMLDLAGIPLRASDRGEGDPLILAGGAVTNNPEPAAPFFDLVLLGDVLDAQTVLVPRPNVKQVRRWLVEHGYLADKGPKLK